MTDDRKTRRPSAAAGGKPGGKFSGKPGGKVAGTGRTGEAVPRRGAPEGDSGANPWADPSTSGRRGAPKAAGKAGGKPAGRDGEKRGFGKPGAGRDGEKRGFGKPGAGRDGEKRGFGKPGAGRDGEKRGFGKPGAGRDGEKRGFGKPGAGRDGEKRGFGKPGAGRDGEKRGYGKPGAGRDGEKRDFGKPRGPRGEGDRPQKPRHKRGEDRPQQQAPRLPQDPRRATLRLLEGVLSENRLMSEMQPALAPLAPEDRARTQRLTGEVLRFLPRLDALLAQHMDRLPDLEVLNVLRLAALELVQGAAPHGVVNEAVNICSKLPRHAHLKGLVNAVLRRVAETGPEAWAAMPAPRLPEWLRGPLAEAWGEAAMQAMEVAHAAPAPLDLTPRDPSEAAALAAEVEGTLLPTGSIRLGEAGKVSALPGFSTGQWWVQDAAAALPARLLAARPGETVLDLCAAPGGKTMQLAATGAEVTALDISAKRLEVVLENLKRTGLRAATVTGDARSYAGGPFDAILLDAPCSATGTIRRHPDLPHAKDGSDFAALIDLQAELIDHALGLLKPGGRLVFCTCSLLPDEGEVQIEEALERHPGLSVDPVPQDLPGLEPAWLAPEGGLRLRPDFWADKGGMDGFYMAVLRKPA